MQASSGDGQGQPFVPPAFHLLFSDSLTITMEENKNVLGLHFVFFSLIENREDVEGMQRHFPLCFCG